MTSSSLNKKLLREMLRLRMVEERIAALYHKTNEMKTPTHLYTGQEAVAVGVCNALEPADIVCTYHRSHGWYLAKGGDLNAMMAEMFGKETGCAKGWGGSMHLIDVAHGVMGTSAILGGTTPHAVGCALAFQMKKEKRVAIASSGDAVIEEGVFHESLNWASMKKLPVVFVCENNLYSTHTPLEERQPAIEIYKRAESYGIPGIRVDGNNVLEVFSAAQKAIERARDGGGPTLIEAMTYRWREHVGPNFDFDLGYRTKRELDEWMDQCPIKNFKHIVSVEEFKSLEAQLNEEIDVAIDFSRRSSFPNKELVTNEI